jgi:siderophore synthetase component
MFAMAANFSYFVNKKIVISMLNCYCREHLIFFNAFCGTDITVGAQYATLTLSSCPGALIE